MELLKDTVRLVDEQVGQFMSGAIFFKGAAHVFFNFREEHELAELR